MIVFFDPETLWHHLVIHEVDMTDTSLWDNRDDWIHIHHSAGLLPHHDMEVTRDADGALGVRHKVTGAALPIVRRLATFSVSAAIGAKVGDVVRLTNIPIGTEILFRGRTVGVMDAADGVVEVQPQETGRHQFQLRMKGYKPQMIAIEVAA